MDNLYNSSCVGGAAGYIDRWILGINHIYSNPTPKAIYGSGPFDPEGILGMVYFYTEHSGVTLCLNDHSILISLKIVVIFS
mgnify:CR=1 FL=1